jgi:hypothetical protein
MNSLFTLCVTAFPAKEEGATKALAHARLATATHAAAFMMLEVRGARTVSMQGSVRSPASSEPGKLMNCNFLHLYSETVMFQRILCEPSQIMMQQAALEERERERISYPHRTPRKRAASKTPKGIAATTAAQLLWQRDLASDAAPASDAPSPQLARLQPSSSASKKSSPAARSDRVR